MTPRRTRASPRPTSATGAPAFAEIGAEDPEGFEAFLRTDAAFALPRRREVRRAVERVQDGLGDLCARPDGLPALVVCHRGVIRLALAGASGDRARRRAMEIAQRRRW